VKYHRDIRHQVIDRKVIREGQRAEDGDKKPTTLPANKIRSDASRRMTSGSVSAGYVARQHLNQRIDVRVCQRGQTDTAQGSGVGLVSVTCSIFAHRA
jgi:hypothetical protein